MNHIEALRRGVEAGVWRKWNDDGTLASQVIEREGWFQVRTPSSTEPWLNRIERSSSVTRQQMREVIEDHRSRGAQLAWSVWDSDPPSVALNLEELGLKVDRTAVAMLADVKELLTHWKSSPNAPFFRSFQVIAGQEASREKDLQSYLDAATAGWGGNAHTRAGIEANMRLSLRTEAAFRTYWAVEWGSTPGGAGSLAVTSNLGYLMGSSVAPAQRKKGLYRELVRVRLAYLSENKIPWAGIIALENTSAPICASLGFKVIDRVKVFGF